MKYLWVRKLAFVSTEYKTWVSHGIQNLGEHGVLSMSMEYI